MPPRSPLAAVASFARSISPFGRRQTAREPNADGVAASTAQRVPASVGASMTAVQEQPKQTVSATGFEEVVLRKANKADVLGLVCNGRLVSDGTTEVVVQELKKGSIAEASVALKKGMLIKAVNGEPVGSAIDATAKMKAAFPEVRLLVFSPLVGGGPNETSAPSTPNGTPSLPSTSVTSGWDFRHPWISPLETPPKEEELGVDEHGTSGMEFVGGQLPNMGGQLDLRDAYLASFEAPLTTAVPVEEQAGSEAEKHPVGQPAGAAPEAAEEEGVDETVAAAEAEAAEAEAAVLEAATVAVLKEAAEETAAAVGEAAAAAEAAAPAKAAEAAEAEAAEVEAAAAEAAAAALAAAAVTEAVEQVAAEAEAAAAQAAAAATQAMADSVAAPSAAAPVIPTDSPFAATAKAPSSVTAKAPSSVTAKAPSSVPTPSVVSHTSQDQLAYLIQAAAFSFSFAQTPPPVEAPPLVPVTCVEEAEAAVAELVASSDGNTKPPQRKKMGRARRRKGGTEAEAEAEVEVEAEAEAEAEVEGGEEDEGAAEEQTKQPAPSKQIDLAQSFDLSGFAAAVAAEAEGGVAAEAEGSTSSSAVRDGVRRIFHGEEAQQAMEVAAEAAANAAAALADLIASGEPLFTIGEHAEVPVSPGSPTRSRSEASWLHSRHRGRGPHSPSGSLAPSRSPSGEPKPDVATEPDVAADMADIATPSRRARRDNAAVVGVVTGVVAAGGSGLHEALLPLLEQEQPTHPVTCSSSTTDSAIVAELVKASIDAAVEADQTLRDATSAKLLAETAVVTRLASTAAKQLISTAVERALMVIEAKPTELHRLTPHYDPTRIYKVGDLVSLNGKIYQMAESPGLSGYSPSRPADLLWRFIANGPPAEPPVPPEPPKSPRLRSPEQPPNPETIPVKPPPSLPVKPPSPAAASPAERASAKLELLMLELQELHELQELQERSAALDAALAAEAPFLAATALQAAQRGVVVRKRLSFQAEADAALQTLLVLEAELTEDELSGLQNAADTLTLIPPPPDEPEPQPEADPPVAVLIGTV